MKIKTLGLFLLLLVHCGGRPLAAPLKTRPVAIACTATGSGDQCLQDGDCTSPFACLCLNQISFGNAQQPHGNRCAAAGDCRVDSDCAGGACSPTVSFDCGSFYGVVAYFCHTPGDQCVNDSDCTGEIGGYCAFDATSGHWACGYSHCAG